MIYVDDNLQAWCALQFKAQVQDQDQNLKLKISPMFILQRFNIQ
jgi:hypothetical protein